MGDVIHYILGSSGKVTLCDYWSQRYIFKKTLILDTNLVENVI